MIQTKPVLKFKLELIINCSICPVSFNNLKSFFFVKSCDLDHWDSEDPIPRDELLKRVAGLDGLYCLLTEKIDSELLDAAGEYSQKTLF